MSAARHVHCDTVSVLFTLIVLTTPPLPTHRPALARFDRLVALESGDWILTSFARLTLAFDLEGKAKTESVRRVRVRVGKSPPMVMSQRALILYADTMFCYVVEGPSGDVA